MRRKKPVEFFLRFYDVPQSNIDQCLKELAAIGVSWVKQEQRPLTISCNPIVSGAGEKNVNAEVLLYFKTAAEAQAMRTNTAGQAIYMKYATSVKGSTFEMRVPGQGAFAA